SSSNYYPSARMENRACWKDHCLNFWMFGGSSTDQANDLWVYNYTDDQWAFIKGSFNSALPPDYGTQGVPALTNDPGYRIGASSWTDSQGNLWMFGGQGFIGGMNDLWRFVIDPACPAFVSCNGSAAQFAASNT